MTRGTGELNPRRARVAILLAFGLASLFVAAAVATPWLAAGGVSGAGWLKLSFAPLCHQLAERSLDLGHGPLAVCARCSGLYVGGLIGLFAGAFLVAAGARPRAGWLLWAAAPTVVDAVLPWLGIPNLANVPRMLLAVPPGVMAGLFLAVGLTDLVAASTETRLPTVSTRSLNALEEVDG